MKNNYKQLTRSPSETSILKRSASHAIRSSFRLPKKRMSTQLHALNLEQLPSYIPPKAAALLEINITNPPIHSTQLTTSNSSHLLTNESHIKFATIRKRSVWANNSASKD